MVIGDKVVCCDLGGLGILTGTFKGAKIFTVKWVDSYQEHISFEEIEGKYHLDRFVDAEEYFKVKEK